MTISTTKIPIREIASGADGMVELADSSVAETLSQLGTVRVARTAMMKREVQRLEAAGTDRALRVQVLQARVGNDIEFAREAEFAALRANLDAPEGDPNSWTLYGVALGSASKPAANHRLAVVDQRSGGQLGEAYVDAQGLFSLKLEAVPHDDDPATGATQSGAPARLQVFDPNGALAYSEDDAVEIMAGNVEYRELMIEKNSEAVVTRKKVSKKKAARKKSKKKSKKKR